MDDGLQKLPVMSAEETAQYIATMTRELKKMAESADLQMLAYLLEMAREEAASVGVPVRMLEDQAKMLD